MSDKWWCFANVCISGAFYIVAIIGGGEFYGMVPNLIVAGYFYGRGTQQKEGVE